MVDLKRLGVIFTRSKSTKDLSITECRTNQPEIIPNMECSICHYEIGTPCFDGSIEIAYSLPCGHVFGNLCILRWLRDSPKQSCPNCRRSMIHRGCGHLIMPHEASSAPLAIRDSETPKDCLRCRGEGKVGEILRLEAERLMAQERALRGARTNLPSVFGGFAARGVCSVDERVEALRKGFAEVYERTWMEFAQTERREKW